MPPRHFFWLYKRTVARPGVVNQSEDVADVIKILAQARHLGEVRLDKLGLDTGP